MTFRPLLDQLPVRLASDDFLRRFMSIFEEVNATVTLHADDLEFLCDVTVTSPEMVQYIAQWIGVEGIDPSMSALRQRHLVESWGQLLPWRGTKAGLAGIVEFLTGEDATVEDTGGVFHEGAERPEPGPVVVTIAGTGETTVAQLVSLIEREVPVELDFVLVVGGEQVWPPALEVTPVGTGVSQAS